jgi:hypothetical protein
MQRAREEQRVHEAGGPVLHAHLTLIEVAEPLLLEELKADRRLGPLLIAQLSDRIAVVVPGSGDQFIHHLLRAGHTPKVIEP